MNFELSWFTTLPGIFITAGVILLIVALVILIVTGKKSKKEKKAMEESSKTEGATPEVAAQDIATPVAADPMGGVVVTPAPVDAIAMPEPVAPEAPTMPGMTVPTIDPTAAPAAPVQPEAPESVAAPEVAAPVQPEVPAPVAAPEVAAPVQPEGQPVIYGGANPTAAVGDVNVADSQPHQIYGGADPLENTQPVPSVQPVAPVAPVAAPVMTPEAVNPVTPQ